jgi:hypothetical protein
MRQWIIRIAFCLLLLTLAPIRSPAQQAGGKTHIIMLDASGSMKGRYGNNLRGWLIEPLLKSSAFAPADRVIVRWFDQRGNTKFDPNDPQRKYDGKYDAPAILSRVPMYQDARGANTDIPEALELTLGDINKLPVTGDVLIWLVTDNVQDIGGAGDVGPLYKKIKDDTNFQSAYLFPLTSENGVKLPPDKEAMVMYLLQFSTKPGRPNIDPLADDVGRKIGNAPVTWFPIDKGIELNQANIRINGEPTTIVDGKLILPGVPEGAQPDFTLEFPFESKLRNLRIAKSKIIPLRPTINIPNTIEAAGDSASWQVNITPTNLTLEPGKRSADTYRTKLAGDMTLKPASFWNAVWNSTSDPVETTFEYKLEDIQTDIDRSTLNQVKNLQDIQNNVRQSQKNIHTIKIPMSFQVEYNSLWRRILVGAIALVVIGMMAASAGIFLSKRRYRLSTPFGEETLMLPTIGRNFVTINGDRAAVIKRQFGRLSVAPLGSYTVSGMPHAQKLTGSANTFEIANQIDNKRYLYSLTRATNTVEKSIGHDDFLD